MPDNGPRNDANSTEADEDRDAARTDKCGHESGNHEGRDNRPHDDLRYGIVNERNLRRRRPQCHHRIRGVNRCERDPAVGEVRDEPRRYRLDNSWPFEGKRGKQRCENSWATGNRSCDRRNDNDGSERGDGSPDNCGDDAEPTGGHDSRSVKGANGERNKDVRQNGTEASLGEGDVQGRQESPCTSDDDRCARADRERPSSDPRSNEREWHGKNPQSDDELVGVPPRQR